MEKSDWIWLPNAGHLIIGHECRFHLLTCVGDFIVSTLGEWWPDRQLREVIADSRGIKIEANEDLWDVEYMKKIGFLNIGYERKYESMVFLSEKSPESFLYPVTIADWKEIDFIGYNEAKDAWKGHMELCDKWSKLTKSNYESEERSQSLLTCISEILEESLKEHDNII